MRRKWNIEPDAELALFVGSLLPGKGVRELTEAAAMLFPNRPKLRLAIIGNGPLRERLNQEVAASPYAGRIRVLGPRSAWEIGEWLGAANLLTLPSHSEGCPNVIVEALSSGRPVVATNVGGIPELLNDSNGVMTPPKDPAKLAGALAAALDRNWDEQFIHQTAGRSWDRAAEETLAVCQETYHRATRRKVYSIAGSSEEDPSHMPPLSSRKLRITIVTAFFPSDADPYHGIAVYRTIDELRKFADVRVICPVPASIHKSGASLIPRLMPMSVEPSEVSVKYLPYRTVPLFGRPFNGRSAAAAIARAVEETRPDLILSYWIYPDGYAAVKIAQRLGVPVVLGSRGSDLRCPGSLSMPLTRSAVRHATAVLTVSEDLRRCAIAAGAAPESVTTILNGVNTARFRARNQAACRAALQVAPEKKLILFVGRLSAAKGVRELLAGCAELFPRHPDLELAIIGVGKLLHEVRRFATQHPGRVRVLKTRNRDEVADWMTASDMLCLPSYSEGCPNVVVESLASGRPVVATTVGGIPEILSSDCGVLIAPQSSEEVRRGLDEALRREWNFAHIAEAWSRDWRKVAEETYAVCESLVTKRAAREPEPAAAVAR
jgi:glycosyltransferase involved in cell wall biosynthesis